MKVDPGDIIFLDPKTVVSPKNLEKARNRLASRGSRREHGPVDTVVSGEL